MKFLFSLKLTSLQFGFCVSLGIHAALFGAIAAGGLVLVRHKARFSPDDREHVIKLIIADATDEPVAEPEKQTVSPPPLMPFVQTEAPQPIATKPISAPLPVEEAEPTIQPQPTLTVLSPAPIQQESVVATRAIEPASATASTASSQNCSRGEASSPQPGEDVTTLRATPGIHVWPDYRKKPEPPYPLTARRRRQEGIVLLSVKVTAQGQVERVEVKESSGFGVLDEAAIQAVRSWEFEPARIGSKPVASEIEVPVRFKLTP